jgi:hypothetical protein
VPPETQYADDAEPGAPAAEEEPQEETRRRYSVCSYVCAVAKACEAAFPPPAQLAKQEDEPRADWQSRLTPEEKVALREWRKAHCWHPNQLRHAKATELRREAVLDAARVVLGHRSPQITEVYAESDVNKAAEVKARLG